MKKKNIILYVILFTLSLSSLIIGIINLVNNTNNKERSPKEIFNNSIESIVEIKASNNVSETFGTGFSISEDKICTCLHVVAYDTSEGLKFYDNIQIRYHNSDEYKEVKEVILYDLKSDICFIKSENKNYLNINYNSLSEGDTIYTISNLNNNGLGIEKGIVSVSKILIDVGEYKRECIQLDLTVGSGSSGAPLLNTKGDVVGVISFRMRDNSSNIIYGICYALIITAELFNI